jgi:hypothetical protein
MLASCSPVRAPNHAEVSIRWHLTAMAKRLHYRWTMSAAPARTMRQPSALVAPPGQLLDDANGVRRSRLWPGRERTATHPMHATDRRLLHHLGRVP